MGTAIYINSEVKSDDVFCLKSKEFMDEVDHCIASLQKTPAGINETVLLKREDSLEMRVAFYCDHPFAYVYVSDGKGYRHEESRPFAIQNGCAELHDHVARVLSAQSH
jgi:hypothetical protein